MTSQPSTSRGPGSVLVTGGASGLGAAVVDAVLMAGGKPYVVDRRPPEAEVPHVVTDLADRRAAEAAIGDLCDAAGDVDGLVTAAGVDSPGPLGDVPAADWDRVLEVNLMGTAAAVRAALPTLERSGGRIVTVASTLGMRAVSDATAYCASKFGMVGFSRALAAELAGRIGVTLLVPGGMRTPFFDGRDEKYQPPPGAPLNEPAHVAQAVVFALTQPAGCEIREMVVCHAAESSYP